MGLSKKLMIDGEHELLTVRTHVKALFWPFIALVIICGVAGYLMAVVPDGDNQQMIRLGIVAVAVVILLWFTGMKFLNWLTTTYHITNRRLLTQTGILTRKGRIIPLSRINHVTYDKGITDRILGCGTLVVHDASEQTGLVMPDVPHVEDVHRTLTQLVFDAHEGNYDEDNHPGGGGERPQ